MILTGNEDALGPIVETIHQLVDEIAPEEADHGGEATSFHVETLALVLMVVGSVCIPDRSSPRQAPREEV